MGEKFHCIKCGCEIQDKCFLHMPDGRVMQIEGTDIQGSLRKGFALCVDHNHLAGYYNHLQSKADARFSYILSFCVGCALGAIIITIACLLFSP